MIKGTISGKGHVDTHYWGLWRDVLLLDSGGVFCFCDWLGLQGVCFHHLQNPVLRGDVAVLEWDQERTSVLPSEPLLPLQGGVRAGRVGIQVVLEQIRLGRWTAHKTCHEEMKTAGKMHTLLINTNTDLPYVGLSWWWVHIFSHVICKT